MKKMLTILSTFGLFTTTSASVVSCDELPSKDQEVAKTPLTDELLKDFFETTEFSYTGPFIFKEGEKLNDADGFLIQHLLLKNIYSELNKKYSYEGYDFIGGAIFDFRNQDIVFKNNEILDINAGTISFSSPTIYNQDYNVNYPIRFKFTQTKQIQKFEALETIYDGFFMRLKFTEKKSDKNFINHETDIWTNHFKNIIFNKSELDDEEKNIEYLKEFYNKEIEPLSFSDKLNIDVQECKVMEDIYSVIKPNKLKGKKLQVKIKISLESDPKVSITKSFNDIAFLNDEEV